MKRLLFFLFIAFSGCSKSQSFFDNLIKNGVVGVAEYYAPQSGTITFSDLNFQYSIAGYVRTGFTARSTAGYVEFKTSEVNISIVVGGNWSTASSPFDEQSDCEVLVNGVYNQSIRLTADNTTQTYAITLPAGEKIVRLVNGYTANPSTNGNNITLPENGVYIQGVVTDSNIQIKIPYNPLHKWLYIGNSITTGASATHPSITGLVGLFRNEGRNVQVDAFGARRLLTVTTTNSHDMATAISQQMTGIISNELFILLGTNNFTVGGGHSKASFKLFYQNLLDSVHSQRPDIIVYCISPFNRNNYSTPNSQGATLEDYSDAEQELLVTRTWAKFMYCKNCLSLANTTDGLHPNQTGEQQIHDSISVKYNLLH